MSLNSMRYHIFKYCPCHILQCHHYQKLNILITRLYMYEQLKRWNYFFSIFSENIKINKNKTKRKQLIQINKA